MSIRLESLEPNCHLYNKFNTIRNCSTLTFGGLVGTKKTRDLTIRAGSCPSCVANFSPQEFIDRENYG